MARNLSKSDPALAIEFFLSGFYTYRSELFAPFKGIGVNVVSFHDPVIDGANMEDTDLFEWTRRPGFSVFCPEALADAEIVNQFYSNRNLDGDIVAVFDSNQRLAQFTSTAITTIFTKSTVDQGFVTQVGNFVFFSDGATADFQMWDTVKPLSSINPSAWGLAAPTVVPTVFNTGCWLPFAPQSLNSAILDPNGNVEVVTQVLGVIGQSGQTEPLWPVTISSTTRDGNLQWTNMGPLLSWIPDTFYPTPVVILDTNGNLQLATTASVVPEWNSGTAYVVGDTVSFGGDFFTASSPSTAVAPNPFATVSGVSGGQPFWVLSQNPTQTGSYPTTPFTPTWNTVVGGTTSDGSYTWTNLGPGFLVESFGTSYVYCYRTIYGSLTTASQPSINTGSIFGPQVATITSFTIAGGIVTFQGTNNFIPGSVFSVQGLSVGTYLNNQTFVVLAAGLSTTQFSAVFASAPVSATADEGTTLPLIATVTGVGTDSPLCNATAMITAFNVVNSVVTLFAVNNFTPGLQVTITDMTVATFLNGLQFQIINVDPDGAWFQILFTSPLGVPLPNFNTTTDVGLATFNAIEIYRVSDGGGIYLFTGAVTNPVGGSAPYDSGFQIAGRGSNGGGPFPWTNPNNVTSSSSYATVAIPTPAGGGGVFTVLQTTTGSTSPAAFSVPVTAGSTILVFLHSPGGLASVNDTQGNSYNLIASETDNLIFRATSVNAGLTTITATGADIYGAAECTGLNGTIDDQAGRTQVGGTTFNSGTITTSGANSVVLSFVYDLNGIPTAPNGYTSLLSKVVFNVNSEFISVVYQVQSATGTFSPTWALTGTNSLIGITQALDLAETNSSNPLIANQFGMTVPAGTVISGIEIELEAFFNGTPPFGVIQVQLRNAFGHPVGAVMTALLTTSSATYTFGGANSLWGFPWTPAEVDAVRWGVQITVLQLSGGTNATFSVRNVRARVFGNAITGLWSFDDFTADEDLNELEIAPQNHQNDPPPGAPGSSVTQTVGNITAYWSGRLWMVSGNYVYFTAGPDCTNGDPQSSWPPANRFQFAGPPLALIPSPDGAALIVCLADRYNAILGGPETISFYPADALGNFGISNPNAIFKDGSVIGQFTTQSQYMDLIGGQKEDTGQHIADYLMDNVSPQKAYVTMHRNGLDVGMFISNGVDRILRFGNNITAWSVPAFPVGGAGALRSIETSVGVYSLMLASPVASSSSHLLARDVDSWGDQGTFGANDGTPYADCFITLGSITLSQPGARMFPLQHVVGYFDAVGTLTNGGPSEPNIWIMPNEVSDTAGIGFVELPEVLQEPPQGQNHPSKSLLSLRWNVNMMNSFSASQYVHHLQVKIEFEPENAPNTIKAIAFGEDQTT